MVRTIQRNIVRNMVRSNKIRGMWHQLRGEKVQVKTTLLSRIKKSLRKMIRQSRRRNR